MDHYFTNKPVSKDEERSFEWNINGNKLIFHTSSSVFSKKRVDLGSDLIINTAIEDIKKSTVRILDVGCGYGPIGISLAKLLPQSNVDMIDINERAIKLTKKNIKNNNIRNAKAFVSNLYDKVEDTYDVILSNPPIRAGKKVVYSIFNGSFERLNKGGCFYCVLQKKQGAPSAMKELKRIFGNCNTINKKSGYYILKSEKNSR